MVPMYMTNLETIQELAFAVTQQNMLNLLWDYHKYILTEVVVDKQGRGDVSMAVKMIGEQVHMIGAKVYRIEMALMKIQ